MTDSVKGKVTAMTLEEKASFVSGLNFWMTKPLERLGLDSLMLTDGPHGLRKQSGSSDHLGLNISDPATCFPTASVSAASFDPALLEEMGESLGDKCIRENVAVILGPGVNMKRSPLCGRNFEYFSEDPLLAGELAAGLVKGVQSKGVGTSLKHFAANNQESFRMVNSSMVDERALREIYFPAFERCIKKSQPWTVMCSYNRINGVYSSSNKWLLEDVLRGEWGYEGMVVSDWGATEDAVLAIKAGMDYEMPSSGDVNAKRIVAAVKNGELDEADLDRCVERVVKMYLLAQKPKSATRTEEMDHELAGKVATESMVLLKNEGILPLNNTERVAVIGNMAQSPRYQGAGSSKINPSFMDSFLDAINKSGRTVDFAKGYCEGVGEDTKEEDERLLAEACEAAAKADKVVIFAGLPDEYESEGYDRMTMDMPPVHNRLIEEISKVNKEVVVVLQLGAPVTMPWIDNVKGVLAAYLSGQAGGIACEKLLYGEANPSGRLAETWPLKLEDNPSFGNFPGKIRAVYYKESIYSGYRYYNTVNCPVRFPFGYGLSYTDFTYSNMVVEKVGEEDSCNFVVKVDVTNTGAMAGKEVVQVYISKKDSRIFRASSELKAFTKVMLMPGETKTVEMTLDFDSFRYYNTEAKTFAVEGGEYEINVAKSSRDFVLTNCITLKGDGLEEKLVKKYNDLAAYQNPSFPFKASDEEFEKLLGMPLPTGEPVKKGDFTPSSCIEEIKDTLIGKIMIKVARKTMGGMMEDNADPGMAKMAEAMAFSMPLRAMTMSGFLTLNQIDGMVDMANGHYFKGIGKMIKK